MPAHFFTLISSVFYLHKNATINLSLRLSSIGISFVGNPAKECSVYKPLQSTLEPTISQ